MADYLHRQSPKLFRAAFAFGAGAIILRMLCVFVIINNTILKGFSEAPINHNLRVQDNAILQSQLTHLPKIVFSFFPTSGLFLAKLALPV